MTTTHPHDGLFGRHELLRSIELLLRQQRHVLLFGPQGIGKTALIAALRVKDVMIVDPLERISSHRAAHIRRAMDRGAVHIGAARSLDRVRLGCVGRIIWRFTTVRVRPLSDVWIRRLIRRECVAAHIPVELLTSNWMKTVTRLAQGRPGVAVAIVQGASHMWMKAARLPAPAAAYLESYIQRAGERVGAQAESRA